MGPKKNPRRNSGKHTTRIPSVRHGGQYGDRLFRAANNIPEIDRRSAAAGAEVERRTDESLDELMRDRG